jgi:hypothetical protein
MPVNEFTTVGKGASSTGTLSVPYADIYAFAVSVEPTNAPLTTPSHVLAVGTAS